MKTLILALTLMLPLAASAEYYAPGEFGGTPTGGYGIQNQGFGNHLSEAYLARKAQAQARASQPRYQAPTYSTNNSYGTTYSTHNNYGRQNATYNNYGHSNSTTNNYGRANATYNNYGHGNITVNQYGTGNVRVVPKK